MSNEKKMMGMSDYQAGYQAYFNDEPFCHTRSEEWQRGWEDAEDDDLYSTDYDYYDDFGD